MRNKKNIFIILCMILLVFFTVSLKADSGWDGSYDSGGSSSGGGSSYGGSSWGGSSGGSSWSSSSGRGSGSYSNRGSSNTNPIVTIIIFVIVIYIIYKTMINGKLEKRAISNMNFKVSPLKIEIIKEVLPNFDKNEFRQTTFKVYKNIQESWMNFDYDTLKKNTTNELYNVYHSELLALKAKKQKNIMKDFELLDFEIVDMEKGKDNISLKTRSLIKCYDYVVNESGKVLRGTDKRKVVYNYEMTFTLGLDEKNNKCPNCNAPLEKVASSTCPYCDSTVINSNHDWVLSKKQVISQENE